MNKIVKSVNPQGSFDSQWGTFYKFNLEFEDGMKGEYLSKSEQQNKFIVGQAVDIEVTTRDYNGSKVNKIKRASTFEGNFKASNGQSNNKDTQVYIIKQNALTNACNIVGTDDVAKIIEIADLFKEWVLNDVKPKSNGNGTDLPF